LPIITSFFIVSPPVEAHLFVFSNYPGSRNL
jgi:hypothetical protein